MGIKIENTFAVSAPVEEVWQIVIDVPRVVPCMPGTELDEVLDERRFRATARLRVGPVELQFKGEGELHDADAAAHTVKLRAKGADAKGRGAFQTEMAIALAPQGGETAVRVDTDLTLSGSVAQYGRGAGVVKEMAREIAAQFGRNLAGLVSRGGAGATPATATATTTATGQTPQPDESERAAPISGLALLFAVIKAWLRRLFGARS